MKLPMSKKLMDSNNNNKPLQPKMGNNNLRSKNNSRVIKNL